MRATTSIFFKHLGKIEGFLKHVLRMFSNVVYLFGSKCLDCKPLSELAITTQDCILMFPNIIGMNLIESNIHFFKDFISDCIVNKGTNMEHQIQ